MSYEIFPGLTGNIIGKKVKGSIYEYYFDKDQKFWNSSEVDGEILAKMPSRKFDTNVHGRLKFGGMDYEIGGKIKKDTNERIFMYMIYKNLNTYKDNAITDDNIFWAADNKIYRVGIYRELPEDGVKRDEYSAMFLESDSKIVRLPGPIIQEINNYKIWNYQVNCQINMVIDGRLVEMYNNWGKIIYLDGKYYSPDSVIELESGQEESIFPDGTAILAIEKLADFIYIVGSNGIALSCPLGVGDSIICEPNSPDIYLADSQNGVKSCRMLCSSLVDMFRAYGFQIAPPDAKIQYPEHMIIKGVTMMRDEIYVLVGNYSFVVGHIPA